MSALWVAWAFTAAVAIAAVALAPHLQVQRTLRSKVAVRYLVFTVDGEVFDGLLADHDKTWSVWADVHSRGQAVPVAAAPGDTRVRWDRVMRLQRVAAEQPGAFLPTGPEPDLRAA